MSEEQLNKYKKIYKISFIIELIVFFCVVGVHGAIEKRSMGNELREHQMTVVAVDKSVSESFNSHQLTYKVRYAVEINGEETWFSSNNPQMDYVTVSEGSKVKIYEYKGQYSTKLDTFTVKGTYRIVLIIDIVAVIFSIFLAVIVKLYDKP